MMISMYEYRMITIQCTYSSSFSDLLATGLFVVEDSGGSGLNYLHNREHEKHNTGTDASDARGW